jgi:hypothetical protein
LSKSVGKELPADAIGRANADDLDDAQRRVVALFAVMLFDGPEDREKRFLRGSGSRECADPRFQRVFVRSCAKGIDHFVVPGRSHDPDVTVPRQQPHSLAVVGIDDHCDTMLVRHPQSRCSVLRPWRYLAAASSLAYERRSSRSVRPPRSA